MITIEEIRKAAKAVDWTVISHDAWYEDAAPYDCTSEIILAANAADSDPVVCITRDIEFRGYGSDLTAAKDQARKNVMLFLEAVRRMMGKEPITTKSEEVKHLRERIAAYDAALTEAVLAFSHLRDELHGDVK